MQNNPAPKDVVELFKVLESTPLFMSHLDSSFGEDNDTLAALQSLVYDGTPDEIALNFKEQGNDCFKDGPKYYRNAIEYYSKGIAAAPDDQDLKSVLHSNRAAVNLELGNFRKAINDCAEAIKINPRNVKAYYRSIKALFALDRFEEALDCCEYAYSKVIQADPQNASMKIEKKRIQDKLTQIAQKEQKAKLSEQLKVEFEEKIVAALKERNIVTILSTAESRGKRSLTLPGQAKLGTEYLSGYIPQMSSEDGGLTVPVLFLYPEFEQSDMISQFHEEDTFQDHIEMMFSESDRPPWDEKHHYDPSSITVYFETRMDLDKSLAGKPRIYQVDKNLPLLEAMKHKSFRLVDGIATFLLVSTNDSEERNDLLFMGGFLRSDQAPDASCAMQNDISEALVSNASLQDHLRSLLRMVDKNLKENSAAQTRLAEAIKISKKTSHRYFFQQPTYFCDEDGNVPDDPIRDVDVYQKKVKYLHRKSNSIRKGD
ncbi:hypothetical protein HDU67_007995 [Dinochytrium kinnereticum]|nr:hypothetical protein HDU67_007995 [Dinochytrium kinnereticum]